MSHNVTEAESGRARKEYHFKMLQSSDHELFISLSLENELSLLDIIKQVVSVYQQSHQRIRLCFNNSYLYT